MGRLNIQTFVAGSGDFESRQYQILQMLKVYREEFSRNRLYPSLAELVDLHTALTTILDEKQNIQNNLPHRMTGVDIEEKRIIFEPSMECDTEFERSIELIIWAMPRIHEVIEEGVSIHDFVEENISISQVGIMPMYRTEGYWFVPDLKAAALNLFRYEATLYTSSTGRYRSLKTAFIEFVENNSPRLSPQALKQKLIARFPELPNPATFACETDLDFPFVETILPVSKRILMASVFC